MVADSCESGIVWDEAAAWSKVDEEETPDGCEAPATPFMLAAVLDIEEAAPESARGLVMGGVPGTVKSLPSRLDEERDTATAVLGSDCDMQDRKSNWENPSDSLDRGSSGTSRPRALSGGLSIIQS